MLGEYKDSLWGLYDSIVEHVQQVPHIRMRVFFLSSLALCASVLGQASVDSYIAKEAPIAKAGLLANIGPSGPKSQGAMAGVVVASPTRVDPDYVFTWVRDSSLVFKLLIDQYTLGQDTSPSLRSLIDAFVASQARIQKVTNPSGAISTGGLGEPKFHINETAFTDGWGRPQRDGPSLRATSFITYAKWLWANGNTTYVTNTLWPIIKLDLDYSARYWNQTGFDLWEEISSSSFFTTAVQHRALHEGAAFARTIGQTASASSYAAQAANVVCFQQSYWNPSQGYITSNTGGGRSGKDANSALASLHNFDPEAGCDATTFQPCSDKALASLKVFVDSFRQIYSINQGIPANQAIATGRYAEDVYYGGHPWYLSTTAVAEQLYDAVIVWKKIGSLTITNVSLPFFRQFSSSVATGTYSSTSATYQTLTTAIKNFADGFIAVVAKYTPADGSLAEQYNRNTGVPLSAKDLTWSYAAALTAFNARSGGSAASWGAKSVTLPTVCGTNTGPVVRVTFNVKATTVPGENIYITGNVDALKGWSPDNALLLSSTNYPTWSIAIDIPADAVVEYKYIRKNNGAVTWESDPNRSFTTPSSGTFTANDSWR